MSPAREGTVSVERRASGAAATFDGNHTRSLLSWMFANEHFLPENMPGMVEELMLWTAEGHLAWLFVPPEGFRL